MFFNGLIGIQHTPVLSVSEEYQADNVTVTIMWAPAELMDDITFSTKVSPLVPIIPTGSTSRQLIILYNAEYNLSVVAVTPCGNVTTSVTLNYGEAKLVVMQSCQLYYTHMNVDFVINNFV